MPLCSAPIPSPRDSTWQTAFGRFAMSTPVPLRSDFDAAQLHKLARGSRDPDQTRRLLALAEVYAGGSRVTMRKTRRLLQRSKKILGDRGGDSRRGSWQADRDLVPR